MAIPFRHRHTQCWVLTPLWTETSTRCISSTYLIRVSVSCVMCKKSDSWTADPTTDVALEVKSLEEGGILNLRRCRFSLISLIRFSSNPSTAILFFALQVILYDTRFQFIRRNITGLQVRLQSVLVALVLPATSSFTVGKLSIDKKNPTIVHANSVTRPSKLCRH